MITDEGEVRKKNQDLIGHSIELVKKPPPNLHFFFWRCLSSLIPFGYN